MILASSLDAFEPPRRCSRAFYIIFSEKLFFLTGGPARTGPGRAEPTRPQTNFGFHSNQANFSPFALPAGQPL